MMFVVPDFMAPAYVFVAAMASCRGDGVVASASPTPPAHEGTRTPLAYRSRPATAGTFVYARRASPPRPRRRRPRRGLMPGRSARRRRASCPGRLFHSSGAAPGTSQQHYPFARPRPSPSSSVEATRPLYNRPLLLIQAARGSCTCPATGAFAGAAPPWWRSAAAASSPASTDAF